MKIHNIKSYSYDNLETAFIPKVTMSNIVRCVTKVFSGTLMIANKILI